MPSKARSSPPSAPSITRIEIPTVPDSDEETQRDQLEDLIKAYHDLILAYEGHRKAKLWRQGVQSLIMQYDGRTTERSNYDIVRSHIENSVNHYVESVWLRCNRMVQYHSNVTTLGA